MPSGGGVKQGARQAEWEDALLSPTAGAANSSMLLSSYNELTAGFMMPPYTLTAGSMDMATVN